MGRRKLFPPVEEPVGAQALSHVRLFSTPWTVAHQAPLSIGYFQARILECAAITGDLPNSGIEPKSLASLPLAGRLFSTEPPLKTIPCSLNSLHTCVSRASVKMQVLIQQI